MKPGNEMKEWYLIVDVAKCENCNNCFLACRDEHVGNDWPGVSAPQQGKGRGWVWIEENVRGQHPLIDVAYLPVRCMHCHEAPCLKAGKGAVSKRQDGIVLIDPSKAKGNRDLASSCPYGAITWNEEQDVPQKCTLCAHLLDDGWEKTRCVQSCPTGALEILRVEEGEMEKIVREEDLATYRPELGTMPRVYYRNLSRFTGCFLGGTVAITRDGREECAAGAELTLFRGDQAVAETLADEFGDFKFDGLECQSGLYSVRVSMKGFETRTVRVDLKESTNVGTIRL